MSICKTVMIKKSGLVRNRMDDALSLGSVSAFLVKKYFKIIY